MKLVILLAVFAVGDVFGGTFTLSSGDPNLISSQPIQTVTPVPCGGVQGPFCWPDLGAPWISNQNSGWNGDNLNEPTGIVFTVFEAFTVESPSSLDVTFAGDDGAALGVINAATLLQTALGFGDFFNPGHAMVQLSPGSYFLQLDVSNLHQWPNNNFGNFSAGTFLGTVSEIPTAADAPEPGTWAMLASGLTLALIGKRRRTTSR